MSLETVKPWTGIFMLRNLKQPETYFQAAFRVQSPWTAGDEIIKHDCYVYTGINKHEGEAVGGYSTVLEENEYHDLYGAETDPPYLKVGDKVDVVGAGTCTVTSVQKERFSVKDSKGKTTRYVYPNAFEYGTVKLHKK